MKVNDVIKINDLCVGKWWLPENPGKKVDGALKITPGEGAKLELYDILGNTDSIKEKYELILGITSYGSDITLYSCFIEESTLGHIKSMKLKVYCVIDGAHYESKDSIRFQSVSIQLPYIEEWENVACFDIKRNENNNEILIKYKKSDSVMLYKSKEFRLEIIHHQKNLWFSEVQKEVHLKQSSFFEITCLADKSFGNYSRILFNLIKLFSFIAMKPLLPIEVRAIDENSSFTFPIWIYYPIISSIDFKPIFRLSLLFTLDDIKEISQQVFENWFRKGDLLKPVFNLYFCTFYDSEMYLEHRFLCLVQALESYHRRTKKNTDLLQELHKERIAVILNSVPSEHKNWLREKLRYSNEPSLRKRLNEIIDEYSLIIGKIIENKDRFIQKIVNTRNYYTHYDKGLKDKAAKGIELLILSRKIRILIELCILSELGFDKSFLERVFPKLEKRL